MIRLVAKVGLIIEFNMATPEQESKLVDKFVLGTVPSSTILKLGKYGKIKVIDIADMTYLPLKTKPLEVKLEDLFNGSKDFSMFNSKG